MQDLLSPTFSAMVIYIKLQKAALTGGALRFCMQEVVSNVERNELIVCL